MHLCNEEIAALQIASTHLHCVVCWLKVVYQWLRCRLAGCPQFSDASCATCGYTQAEREWLGSRLEQCPVGCGRPQRCECHEEGCTCCDYNEAYR